MRSNLAILNEQIHELETELEAADKEHSAAVSALAAAPTDAAARVKVRVAATRSSDLRCDMLVLRNAAAAAEAVQANEEVQAKKREAATLLRKAEELGAERIKIAKAVDTALADFLKVMHQWVAVNDQMRGAVVEFYRLVVPDRNSRHSYYLGLGDLTQVAGNAVACQVEEAIRPAGFHENFSLNFTRKRPDEPELVARDGASPADIVLLTMRSIAAAEGLPLTPASSARPKRGQD